MADVGIKVVCFVNSHGLLEDDGPQEDAGKVYHQGPKRTTFPATLKVTITGGRDAGEYAVDLHLPLGGGPEIRRAICDGVKNVLETRGIVIGPSSEFSIN